MPVFRSNAVTDILFTTHIKSKSQTLERASAFHAKRLRYPLPSPPLPPKKTGTRRAIGIYYSSTVSILSYGIIECQMQLNISQIIQT